MAPAELSPLQLLRPLATRQIEVKPGLRHIETYTMEGLLGILWHGPDWSEDAVLLCGGGMGGFLGPGEALYPWLGEHLAEGGMATLRVDYRRPNNLEACVLDVCAAADLASQRGATRFVVVGHSFGGAVAVNTALALPSHVKGVVTLSTQSAGCEPAAGLGDRPFLLVHGDADEILSAECSMVVQALAGSGQVVIVPGDGHLLDGAGPWLRRVLPDWIGDVLGGGRPRAEEVGGGSGSFAR